MALESELKLHIHPAELQRIKNFPCLNQSNVHYQHGQHVVSHYYDTENFALKRQGWSLRVREQQGQYIQTLKGQGRVFAGLHQRQEFEYSLDGPHINLDLIAEPQVQQMIHGVNVQSIFVTDFYRETWIMTFPQQTLIEFAMDFGDVKSNKCAYIISEIEMELKQGDIVYAYGLALEIARQVNVQLAVISKAGHGYRLLGSLAEPISSKQLNHIQAQQKSVDMNCLLQNFQTLAKSLMMSDDRALYPYYFAYLEQIIMIASLLSHDIAKTSRQLEKILQDYHVNPLSISHEQLLATYKQPLLNYLLLQIGEFLIK